jgi:CRP-like cAMP-binding protein
MQCSLFTGLSAEALEEALSFFQATPHPYEKGERLHRIGEALPAFGLVLSGTVQVSCDDIEGNPMIMAHVAPGDTFGESLCFLKRPASISIKALTACSVLWLRPDHLSDLKTPLDFELSHRFIAMLAGRTLSMNNRIQILSKLTLREKLIAFFSQYGTAGTPFTVPFRREDMAVYLGTNRSALSRELSRMRDDGLIEYDKNRFVIRENRDSRK